MEKKPLIAIVVVIVVIIAAAVVIVELQKPSAKTNHEIVIGMPYASSGSFAFSSNAVKQGFNMWVNQTNAKGGLVLSGTGYNYTLKVDYLDDQSSTTQVATDYTNLITQDNVNILMADFGSTLTAPGIPIAQNHKMILFDTSGSTPTFFNSSNPYMVDLTIQSSSLWPTPLAQFVVSEKSTISKVAILYTTQDFTTAQANTVDTYLVAHGITPVYYKGTSDSSTSEYLTTLAALNATHPNAVLEFGYNTNDEAFLTAMNQGNYHFNMTFTIYGGLETATVAANSPAGSLNYTYAYAAPPYTQYSSVQLGPTTAQFSSEWEANHSAAPNFNNIVGYNAGQLLGKIITKAGDLKQVDLRAAANATSGTTTLEGQYMLNNTTGMQLGMSMNLMQFQPKSTGLVPVVIYPTAVANGSAVYPAPSVVIESGHFANAKQQFVSNDLQAMDLTLFRLL